MRKERSSMVIGGGETDGEIEPFARDGFVESKRGE